MCKALLTKVKSVPLVRVCMGTGTSWWYSEPDADREALMLR